MYSKYLRRSAGKVNLHELYIAAEIIAELMKIQQSVGSDTDTPVEWGSIVKVSKGKHK